MNRQERRKQQRELQKNAETIIKLTPKQTQIVDIVSNEKAKRIADEKIQTFSDTFARCIPAFLIQTFPEKSMDEISKLEEDYSELVIEDITKFTELIKEYGGKEMVEKAMKKYEEEVIARTEKLFVKNLSQKDAIAELVAEFPKLSKSMLTNVYKRCKNDWEKAHPVEETETDPDVKEALEYIFDEEERIDINKVLEESDKLVEEAEKQSSVENAAVNETIEDKQKLSEKVAEEDHVITENKYPKKSSLLTVADMTITLLGADNMYKLSKDRMDITLDGEQYVIEKQEDFNQLVNDITANYDRLIGELHEAFSTWEFKCRKVM